MTKTVIPANQPTHNPWNAVADPGDPAHRGEDYGWASGDAILAAADGVVVTVYDDNGWNQGWGNRIRIQHAGVDNYTTYNHIRPGGFRVKVGDKVKAKQIIAWMGSTGNAQFKHLHYEFERGGRGSAFRVDPATYRRIDMPGTEPKPTPAPAGGGSKPAPAGLSKTQRKTRNLGSKSWVNGRSKPHTNGDAKQRLEPNTVANFDAWTRGQKVTIDGITSDVWFRGAFKKNWFAAAGFTSQKTDGLKELKQPAAPKTKKVFRAPANGQVYYHQYTNAQNGNADFSQVLPKGDYTILENPGRGSIKVKSKFGNVWVGTKNHPAKITTVRA